MGDPHENDNCAWLSLECEGKVLFFEQVSPALPVRGERRRRGVPRVFRPKGRGRGVLIVDQSVGLNQEMWLNEILARMPILNS